MTNGLIVKDLTDDCIGAVFERHGEASPADAAQLEVVTAVKVLSRDAHAWDAVERRRERNGLSGCSRRDVPLLLSAALQADFDAELLNQRVLRNVA